MKKALISGTVIGLTVFAVVLLAYLAIGTVLMSRSLSDQTAIALTKDATGTKDVQFVKKTQDRPWDVLYHLTVSGESVNLRCFVDLNQFPYFQHTCYMQNVS